MNGRTDGCTGVLTNRGEELTTFKKKRRTTNKPSLINLNRSRLTGQLWTSWYLVVSPDLFKSSRRRRAQIKPTAVTRKQKTTNKISAKFNGKTLPKIEVEPEYETINKMMQLLYYNAETLLMPQGGGRHRHIGILIKPTLYTTLSTTAWRNTLDPGRYPMVVTNATTAHQE